MQKKKDHSACFAGLFLNGTIFFQILFYTYVKGRGPGVKPEAEAKKMR